MAAKKQSEKQKMLSEKRKEERKKLRMTKQKRTRRKKILITGTICVLAAALITSGTVWTIRTKPLTHLLAVEKTEHYSLNAAEVSFYTWQIYQQYMDSVDSSTAAVPDEDTPLSEQSYDEDTTWEEHFADAGKEYAQNVLALCEAAYAADYEPDDTIPATAKDSLEQFDSSTFPDFITDEDVVHAVELYLTALDYSQVVEEETSSNITEEELEEYYNENSKTMQVCSYMSFSFSYDDSSETANSSTEAQDLARELRRCNTQETFEDWVWDYYAENTTLTDEELDEQVSTLCSENTAYIEGDAISEWVFSGEAQVGDTTIIQDEDAQTYSVCLLLSEPERDEVCPVDLRQILFTSSTYGSTADAQTAAEDLLQQWEASDQTEDTFASLANSYSEDTSADGGLYTDVSQGELLDSWKTWCFDSERKAGDVAILTSSYGACLIYYVGADELPYWKRISTDAVANTHYNDALESYKETADIKTSSLLMHLVKVCAE